MRVYVIVRMKPAEQIIEKFGGISACAKILGHRNPTTVQGWKERGFIPARQQREVLEAARREGIDLDPADFFEPPAKRASLQEAS